nr:gag pol polyprotein [Hymenolepis microstoma]
MSKEAELAILLSTPAFGPENSDSWFTQFEMIIQLRGVTKRTSWFQYLVPILPAAIVTQFKELTSMPPENNSYDRLRQAIISRLSVSRKKRFDQLFVQIELADRSPSQLLRHMRSLDRPAINAVKAPTAADSITQRFDELTEQLQELKVSRSSISPRLNRRRPTSPKRWRSPVRHDNTVCCYHTTFGPTELGS